MIVLCAGSLDAISENLCPDDVLLTAVQRITDLNGGTIQDYYQRKQKNGGRLDGRKGGLSAKTIRRLKQRENIFTKTKISSARPSA